MNEDWEYENGCYEEGLYCNECGNLMLLCPRGNSWYCANCHNEIEIMDEILYYMDKE